MQPVKNFLNYKKNCEFYTKALVLAVTAPTEEYSKECAEMAESIGSNLSEKDRKKYKIAAELAIEIIKTKQFLKNHHEN